MVHEETKFLGDFDEPERSYLCNVGIQLYKDYNPALAKALIGHNYSASCNTFHSFDDYMDVADTIYKPISLAGGLAVIMLTKARIMSGPKDQPKKFKLILVTYW